MFLIYCLLLCTGECVCVCRWTISADTRGTTYIYTFSTYFMQFNSPHLPHIVSNMYSDAHYKYLRTQMEMVRTLPLILPSIVASACRLRRIWNSPNTHERFHNANQNPLNHEKSIFNRTMMYGHLNDNVCCLFNVVSIKLQFPNSIQ